MAYHFATELFDFVEARDVERGDAGIAGEEVEKLLVEAVDVKWSEAVLDE